MLTSDNTKIEVLNSELNSSSSVLQKTYISNTAEIRGIYSISPIIIQFLVVTFFRFFSRFFLRYKITGIENLKDIPPGAIFAANHTSELDPIIVTMALMNESKFKPLFYVSREKKFYINSGWRKIFYGGVVFKLCGAYSVATGIRNYQDSLKSHIKILEEGRSLCIFPEGKKAVTGILGPAKGGIGYLAFKSGRVIVPIAISGISNFNFKDLFWKRQLKIEFGKPITTDTLFKENVPEYFDHKTDPYRMAAEKVMTQIHHLLNR